MLLPLSTVGQFFQKQLHVLLVTSFGSLSTINVTYATDTLNAFLLILKKNLKPDVLCLCFLTEGRRGCSHSKMKISQLHFTLSLKRGKHFKIQEKTMGLIY